MTVNRIFHLSEDSAIGVFHPRPTPYTEDAVVWAISEERLANYLLPRECPRVTYYASATTSEIDRERFLGDARQIVTIEYGWLDRLQNCVLYAYEFATSSFRLLDPVAGYYVSPQSMTPIQTTPVPDLLTALAERQVELRLRTNLWSLSDAVANSTLGFSIIRMRNAQPREHS